MPEKPLCRGAVLGPGHRLHPAGHGTAYRASRLSQRLGCPDTRVYTSLETRPQITSVHFSRDLPGGSIPEQGWAPRAVLPKSRAPGRQVPLGSPVPPRGRLAILLGLFPGGPTPCCLTLFSLPSPKRPKPLSYLIPRRNGGEFMVDMHEVPCRTQALSLVHTGS